MLKKIRYNQLVRSILTTTIWNTFGKGAGFLVPFFIAAWFGVGAETDIFFFIYGIILYVTGVFSDSLESNIPPIMAELKRSQEENLQVFINRLLSLTLLVMAGLTFVIVIFGRHLLNLVTHFSGNYQYLLFQLLVEFSPLLILLVLSSILAGILNANFKFWLPAISPGIRAIVCIGIIFILKQKLGIHSVVLGYVIGEIARLLIFGYVLLKDKFFSLQLDFHFNSTIIRFLKVLSFQIICMTAIGLNPLVDKAMASWLGVGKVSILHYADRLYVIPVVFIFSGLIVVMLSRWSDLYYKHKSIEVLKKNLDKTIGIVVVIAAIATIMLFLFSKQLVEIAYARGKFPMESINLVKSTFLWYLIGVPFYLLGQVVVRAHLVLHNTKALMQTAVIANVLNVVFNLILMRFLDVKGIALSTSVVSVITFFYLYWAFNLKSKEEVLRK